MKTDGLPARNWLKGADGDAIQTVLCAAGYNFWLILRHLRVLVLAVIATPLRAIGLRTLATSPSTARLPAA